MNFQCDFRAHQIRSPSLEKEPEKQGDKLCQKIATATMSQASKNQLPSSARKSGRRLLIQYSSVTALMTSTILILQICRMYSRRTNTESTTDGAPLFARGCSIAENASARAANGSCATATASTANSTFLQPNPWMPPFLVMMVLRMPPSWTSFQILEPFQKII